MPNNKDIKYNGYSAQPSDYECPDGDLALSLNIINEDGNISPLAQPEPFFSLLSGEKLLLIHSVAGQTNYILARGNASGSCEIFWLRVDTDPEPSSSDAAEHICTISNIKDVTSIGNTIVFACAEGLRYLLWKDGSYLYLGERPSFVPVSFGAYKTGTLLKESITTYTQVPDGTYSRYAVHNNGAAAPHPSPWTSSDDEFWQQISNQALGLLLSEVAEHVAAKGYVYQPFFIRYAFRLFDGSYSWHSAPVLILVSTHRPVIHIKCTPEDSEKDMTVSCQLSVPYFGIAYQIFGDLQELNKWSDIVTGIDVFISAPLYTFSQNKKMGVPIALEDLYKDPFIGTTGTNDKRPVTRADADYFIGHYAESITDPYVDHFLSKSGIGGAVCALPPNDSFNDRLQNEFLFYKIAALDIKDMQPMSQMEPLPLIKTDITEITTLQPLSDEYNSHANLIPSILHTYNRRLLFSDASLAPPKPLVPVSLAQCASSTATPATVEKITVYTRVNGTRCVSEFTGQESLPPYPFGEAFPRFIYHPDPAAYKMIITASNGISYAITLSPHTHLNGAFWFGGLGVEPSGVEILDSPSSDNDAATTAPVSGKVYTSEVDNPFIFPPQNIVTVPCGRIIALSSAARPLSQGQSGQFPLYAFTDNDGIWALEISATGTIAARQPITRDICINPNAVTQLDAAVLFPSRRGIMLLSGSQTQCISDSINTDTPFEIRELTGLDTLHSMLAHKDESCISIAPFSEFLQTCGMVYDYVHQHIIVFSPLRTYAYVYSLKSHQWGMIFSEIESVVNSYPEAFAVDKKNRLVDFSKRMSGDVGALLLTRPLKLDTINIHKTVDTIIQRGNFRKGSVKSVLYGSNDLLNWHLVWSSKDHYLRGFRGTPYKYFRIALLCDLSPDESIYGASVQFTPRLTKQPR